MKKILTVIILLFFYFTASAQRGRGNEKIQALKIAYLTEKLALTSKEAEIFWPLYNEHDDVRRKLFDYEKKELKDRMKDGNDFSDVSDKQAEVILKKLYEFREKRHQHKLDFHKKLLRILSAKKILLLEVSEREFNRKLMRKLRNEKNSNE